MALASRASVVRYGVVKLARKPSTRERGRPADTDSDETRQQILDAAKECFGNAGFKSTSNRDIADKAGVTAATIYYYFKNKSDLFISVHHEVQEKILGVTRNGLEGAISLTDGWSEQAAEVSKLYKADPYLPKFLAVVRLEAMRNPELAEALYDDEWRDIFRAFADIGIETGELDPAKERRLRAVLSALNFGMRQHAIESSFEAHELAMRGALDLFRGDLIKPKKGRRKRKA